MPQVTFIDSNGDHRTVDGDIGESVMQVALNHDVPGIIGECGGTCSCATCHVYIGEDWLDRLTPADDYEDEMLDGTLCDRLQNSRLGCQVLLTEALAGLTVTMPERQN